MDSGRIVLKVKNHVTFLEGRLSSELYKDFKKALGYLPENAYWMIRNSIEKDEEEKKKKGNSAKEEEWKKDWDGTISTVCWNKQFCRCNIKKSGTHFPSGLLYKAKEFLSQHGISYDVIDVRSKVPTTADFSLSSEFEYRDYQQEISNKVNTTNRGIVKVATGGGKCINHKSLCLTEDGMLEIGEIGGNLAVRRYRTKKSTVYTPLAVNCRDKTSHIYRDGIKNSIKLVTSYGYSLTGTPNHAIRVVASDGSMQWKKMKDITATDFVVISKGQNLFGSHNTWSIADAYFIGLLYGDGCLNMKNSVDITTADDHIQDYIVAYAKERGLHAAVYLDKRTKDTRRIIVGGKPFRKMLLEKGIDYSLSYTKKIPLSIRTANRSIVAAFLRGIYETDGCVEVNKGKTKVSITLGLSNETLIDQIHYLLLNFGIIASKRKKKTHRRDCYILTIYRPYIGKFLSCIGFDPEGNKRKKINSCWDLYCCKKQNGNKDLIPNHHYKLGCFRHMLRKICGFRRYKSVIKESGVGEKVLRSWAGEGHWRVPNRMTLLRLAKWAEYYFIRNKAGKDHPLYDDLVSLIKDLIEITNNQYYFDSVKRVEKEESDNFDFVVPKTHSFVANGFINHNTGIACDIIHRIGVTPIVFYVPSIDLLKQTKSEIERFIRYKGQPIEVGMVGGGKTDIRDITVMTIQTAVRALGGVWVKYDDEDTEEDDTDISSRRDELKKLIRGCRLMICDEIQHWAAETCQIIADNSWDCQYRYGLSATPWRDKGDDILIDGHFGRCIADISASKLIRNGWLVKPTIYFSSISNIRLTGHQTYNHIYKKAIVENEFRNNRIVQLANLFRSKGRNILILVRQIAHGKLLESLLPDSTFLYGGTAKKKRQKHLELMREGKRPLTIASVIFDEGIDVRPLDTLIQAGSGKSPTRALQRVGRILRPYPGKEDAVVVDFFDNCKYLKDHSQKRLEIYKTEEAFEIVGEEDGK